MPSVRADFTVSKILHMGFSPLVRVGTLSVIALCGVIIALNMPFAKGFLDNQFIHRIAPARLVRASAMLVVLCRTGAVDV